MSRSRAGTAIAERSRTQVRMMDQVDALQIPAVSVVVPVLDVADAVGACLESLLAQTYSRADTQIIVVDNGSRDATRDVVARYPVTLLREDTVRSPYAARNAGLAVARGEIVAFTDGTCVPAADWIERGVDALREHGADLAGGESVFAMSDPPTLGEIADAMLDVDAEASIEAHRACMTCNLFVRRRVFDTVGIFDARLRSGGDMRWTRRASDSGFTLVYAPDAVVSYPARRLGALLRKQYRVGRGAPGVWASFGMGPTRMAVAAARGFLPMPPHRLPGRARRRVGHVSAARLTGVWFVVWLAKVVRGAGCCRGLCRL